MTGISEIWRHEDTKSMVSKLLVALIVIRNSAFFDRNFWNWKTWRHKQYGVKTQFLFIIWGKKFKALLQWICSCFFKIDSFFSIDLSFQDLFNFNFSVSNNKSPLLIPISYPCEELKCMHKQKVWTFFHSGNTNAVYYTQLGCNQVAFLIKWCFMIQFFFVESGIGVMGRLTLFVYVPYS